MAAEIRALNPRPGYAFDRTEVQAIQPDIMVYRLPDGSWQVELNSDNLPRLLVNQQYHARVNGKAQSKQDKDYLADRLSAANWLVKTLHQRATTILKVASEIVRQQEMFFLHGVKHLKPLIRRNIADEIGMHESTVSRVAANKFMATPRGLFELRYFFLGRDSGRRRGRQPLGRGGPLPHQGADRQGGGGSRPVRRPAGRGAQERRRRYRPPDCG